MEKYSQFNHLKIHSQYSICEGAAKIKDLAEFCKKNKVPSVGISDTSNLCGALEFSENLSKSGTQPIIGTQINFKYAGELGLIPIIAKSEKGYKSIIELSSKSFLNNDNLNLPHCQIEDLLKIGNDILVLTGSVNGLIGKLFYKGKFDEIKEIYKSLNKVFIKDFYIEIQRHNDENEKNFENFNLKKSEELDIPIIATNEVFYIDKNMHEAHDALTCIGNKTYISEKNRIKYSNQHYFKSDDEMKKLFFDLPEALENNYNIVFKCNFRPIYSKPVLPNISSDKGGNADEILSKDSLDGLKEKFFKNFQISQEKIEKDENLKFLKDYTPFYINKFLEYFNEAKNCDYIINLIDRNLWSLKNKDNGNLFELKRKYDKYYCNCY